MWLQNKEVFKAVLEEQNLEKKLDHLTEEGKKVKIFHYKLKIILLIIFQVEKMAEALEKLQEFANASRVSFLGFINGIFDAIYSIIFDSISDGRK